MKGPFSGPEACMWWWQEAAAIRRVFGETFGEGFLLGGCGKGPFPRLTTGSEHRTKVICRPPEGTVVYEQDREIHSNG